MLTTSARLRVRRPSPTTTEFTVTTLPKQTLAFRMIRVLLGVLQLSLSLAASLVLYARWTICPLATPLTKIPRARPQHIFTSTDGLWWALDSFQRSFVGTSLARLSAAVPLPVLVPVAFGLLYVSSLRLHAEETLLVMRGLGVQTSESPASYLAGTATRFIPTEKIQDILVNEAFRGFEVRYYLVVVVEGEDDVVVVFPGLLPRRAIVETVWRGARDCLYEGRRDEKNHTL